MTPADPPHVGFFLEPILGHASHAANLERFVPAVDGIDAELVRVPFEREGLAARIPGYGNWTVRAGVRTARRFAAMHRRRRLDAAFLHTQVLAVLGQALAAPIARVPTVVSLDATPIQYDELGQSYDHAVGPRWVESLKWRLNVSCFRRAAHIVTWSDWAKRGLVDRYQAPAEKITTIAPGVDCEQWSRPDDVRHDDEPVRVLFVGGDFGRKGGPLLLGAVRTLRSEPAAPPVELHVVTRSDVPPEPGVVVHHGLGPNDPRLVQLYRDADVFALPTDGDCLPMVLAEAGAMGLPLVSTDVGAISEVVRDGETGMLVGVGDARGLTDSLRALVVEPALRAKLGAGARTLIRRDHDAATNAGRIVEILRDVAASKDRR